jgi:hypothetical protein
VIQIEVGKFGGDLVGIGQSGAVVFRGVARNIERGIHGVAHGLLRKVRRAGIAAPFAYIHADAHAFVAVVLDGLDRALAYRNGLSETFRNFGRTGGSALLAGIVNDIGSQMLQGIGAVEGFCNFAVHKIRGLVRREALS